MRPGRRRRTFAIATGPAPRRFTSVRPRYDGLEVFEARRLRAFEEEKRSAEEAASRGDARRRGIEVSLIKKNGDARREAAGGPSHPQEAGPE